MVESVDEPPLRGLHSWAKNFLPSRKSNERDKSGTATDAEAQQSKISTEKGISLQYAGDTDIERGPTTSATQSASNCEDTKRKDAPAVDEERAGAEPTSMNPEEDASNKAPIYRRLVRYLPFMHPSKGEAVKAPVHERFIRDFKRIISASWINWLLVFVPVAIIVGALHEWGHVHAINPTVVFALNAIAIIPLASQLAYATESVALKLGDSWGALLNVTFGNAVEIIVFVIALQAGEVRIVQSAAVGSILSNLLLVLGMALVLGGLRYREQLYNSTVSQMSACLLSLSVVSLLLPTAFHAAFADAELANRVVLQVSKGTSVVLLVVYVLYLLFQLKSHAYMYESTPQHAIDEESHPGVLARIMDPSSSSSSDTSSDDSDSTAGSIGTTQRIKRALRRRRRKSSSSTKDEVAGSFSRSDTNTATLAESIRTGDDAIHSGDDADSETNRRGRDKAHAVQTRDFEHEAGAEKRVKRTKAKKNSKHSAVPAQQDSNNADMKEKLSIATVPVVAVENTDAVQDISETSSRSPHHHARNLSNAIKPVLNSSNFPHHEAMTRSLAPPILRVQSRTPAGPSERRASSMPNVRRDVSPFTRPVSPSPIGPPVNAGGEVQIVETVEAHPHLSTKAAIIMLLGTTGLVALCAEFLVGSIDYLVQSGGVSPAFIGLIILPIVGNAAEHVTAVTVAYKNKMDLSINIALGSSIQIALFVTPLMVLLGWALSVDMSLYFSLFEVVSLFASAFIVNFMMIDGRSNWLEGTLLVAAYVIIAICAFFIPSCGLSDTNGLVTSPRSC